MHRLWGNATEGTYDKRAWCRFSEGVYEQAERGGYRRPALEEVDEERRVPVFVARDGRLVPFPFQK